MPASTNVYMTVCGEDAEIARFAELLRGADDSTDSPFSYVKTTASAAGYFAFYGLCDHIGAVIAVLTTAYPELYFCGSAGRDSDAWYEIFVARGSAPLKPRSQAIDASGEVPEWNRYPATDEMLKGEFPNRHFSTARER